MPSFCVVETCKLVKQIGDDTSFHKFPFNNTEVLQKWKEFVMQSEQDRTKKQKPKNITKYSSICSRHFNPVDFSYSQSRKFLRKNAVPSLKDANIGFQLKQQPVEDCVEDAEDPLSNFCCCFCRKSSHLSVVDQYSFETIRKCLPTMLTLTPGFHRVCFDCTKLLNTFSAFIDMAITTQNDILGSEIQSIKGNIKVEPMANFEENNESDFHHNQPELQFTNCMTAQKKCEILEIVDIKPFHFDSGLQHEPSEDEDEIQILSPKPLKVELMDPDEEGSNELELIRNYVFISTVFLQDHNYVKSTPIKPGEERVKTEFEEDQQPVVTPLSCKICSLCGKTFKTLKKYLVHKIVAHKSQTHFKKSKSLRRPHKLTSRIEKNVNLMKQPTLEVRQDVIPKKEKIKSYICPTCQKEFKGSKNLYQHKISHTNSNYQCNLCDKMFKRSHGLKQHVKSIHEKEKKHECPICNHKYLLKADMIKCRHSKLKSRM